MSYTEANLGQITDWKLSKSSSRVFLTFVAHAQRRVIVVGRSVGRFVGQSVRKFSLEPWLL